MGYLQHVCLEICVVWELLLVGKSLLHHHHVTLVPLLPGDHKPPRSNVKARKVIDKLVNPCLKVAKMAFEFTTKFSPYHTED